MTIKVLGPGRTQCTSLEGRIRDILFELNLEGEVVKVGNTHEVRRYGITRLPGLVIDERVVWQGGVPTMQKLKQIVVSTQARMNVIKGLQSW